MNIFKLLKINNQYPACSYSNTLYKTNILEKAKRKEQSEKKNCRQLLIYLCKTVSNSH